MKFSIRFRVDSHWKLRSEYRYEVELPKAGGLYAVYRWYVEWLVDQGAGGAVKTALVDELVIDGVPIVTGHILRLNAQTFRKVDRPVVFEEQPLKVDMPLHYVQLWKRR